MLDIPRKNLIVSFIQDKERYGEYFLQLESPQESSEGSKDGKVKLEKKMIPALDIKTVESVDNLSFAIVLHDDCNLNCYDVSEI